jgi:hypothetical protein
MDFLNLIDTFQSNLPKGTKLAPRQMEAARALYTESLNQGVDPRLAISMGWQETKLGGDKAKAIYVGDLNRGQDHALGFMQVLRSTATKDLGLGPEWEAANQEYAKTGKTDAAFSAKSGVGYIKWLIDNKGAKTVSDIAAGYNGGPSKVGKEYGAARPYVENVVKHMGLFGDGRPVAWKQAGVLSGGEFAPLALGSAPAPTAAAPKPPAAAPIGQIDIPKARDPLTSGSPNDTIDSTIKSLLNPFQLEPLQYADTSQSQELDPINRLHSMVSGIYDSIESSQNG